MRFILSRSSDSFSFYSISKKSICIFQSFIHDDDMFSIEIEAKMFIDIVNEILAWKLKTSSC